MIYPPFQDRPGTELAAAAAATPAGENLRLRINGKDEVGNPRSWMVVLKIGSEKTGDDKVKGLGLVLRTEENKVLIDEVEFNSEAKKAGLDWDQEIAKVQQPVEQPTKYLIYIPAFLLLGLLIFLQWRRAGGSGRIGEPVQQT